MLMQFAVVVVQADVAAVHVYSGADEDTATAMPEYD
jgi:hypothetical protein